MSDMNEYIGQIYGTGGMDKVASEDGSEPSLEELSMSIAAEFMNSKGHGGDLEKTAALAHEILEYFGEYDMSGRAVAHQQFGELEKAAAEGNQEPLLAFFGELEASEEPVEGESEAHAAIRLELMKRLQSEG